MAYEPMASRVEGRKDWTFGMECVLARARARGVVSPRSARRLRLAQNEMRRANLNTRRPSLWAPLPPSLRRDSTVRDERDDSFITHDSSSSSSSSSSDDDEEAVRGGVLAGDVSVRGAPRSIERITRRSISSAVPP